MTEAALPSVGFLDISKSNTGVAFGRVGEAPTFVSINGSELDGTGAMMKLGRWLIEWIRVYRPDRLYYEAALSIIPGEYDEETGRVKAKGNPQTTITLAKMTGIVEFIAGMKGIMPRTANVQTARKAFLGQGRPQDPKKRAMAMCRALGWNPKNLDEADAGCGWYWAALQTDPRRAQMVTPMLQAKVASQVEAGTFLRQGKRS